VRKLREADRLLGEGKELVEPSQDTSPAPLQVPQEARIVRKGLP
jgi:hypothetical protein